MVIFFLTSKVFLKLLKIYIKETQMSDYTLAIVECSFEH